MEKDCNSPLSLLLQKLSAGMKRQPKQTCLFQVSSEKTTERLQTAEQETAISRGMKEFNSAGDHTKRTEAGRANYLLNTNICGNTKNIYID